jgi:hypothetical protein
MSNSIKENFSFSFKIKMIRRFKKKRIEIYFSLMPCITNRSGSRNGRKFYAIADNN